MTFYIEKPILEVAPRARLAVIQLDRVQIGFGHEKLDEMRLRVVNKIRDELRTATILKQVPQIAGVEQLLGRFDPAMRRTATSCEAMLRRVLEGGPIPVENDAADLGMLLMVFYKLPVMLSDRSVLRGDVGLVVGREDKSYDVPQGQEEVSSRGRLFLQDDLGYFASPIASGKRAMVTERTRNLLVTCLFPENVGDSIVRDFLRRSTNWLQSLCGGRVTQEGMVGQAEASG